MNPSSHSTLLSRSVPSSPSSISTEFGEMSTFGSHTGTDLDVEEKLTLRVALERSKVNTGGSSGSAPAPGQRGRRSWPLLAHV